MADYLLFDIETAPKEDVLENIRPAFEPEANSGIPEMDLDKAGVEDVKTTIAVSQPDELWVRSHQFLERARKKPRKGVLDALQTRLNEFEDPVPKKWRLAPEAQQIITLGYSLGPDGDVIVDQYDPDTDYEEWLKRILVTFWGNAAKAKVCGWNITGFDIPVLMMESRKRGLKSFSLKFSSYKVHSFSGNEHNMLDLMKVRYPREYRGLRPSALSVGMPASIDAEDTLISGANVARAYENGDGELIANHCRVDIIRLQWLFRAYDELFF